MQPSISPVASTPTISPSSHSPSKLPSATIPTVSPSRSPNISTLPPTPAPTESPTVEESPCGVMTVSGGSPNVNGFYFESDTPYGPRHIFECPKCAGNHIFDITSCPVPEVE